MKLTYHWEGDYLFPDLVTPESPKLGIWGERRRWFLQIHQRPVYNAMIMNGTLHTHLAEVDRTAEARLERLMEQMAKREKITERLKSENQMLWIQKMTNIQNQASEIIYHDLICI